MADDGSRPDSHRRDDPPSDADPLLSPSEVPTGDPSDGSDYRDDDRTVPARSAPTGAESVPDGGTDATPTDETTPATGILPGSSSGVATTGLWLTLLILGCFLAVFALGRAVGLDVSVLVDAALDTDTGQYLLLATVGGLLILLGQRELTSG